MMDKKRQERGNDIWKEERMIQIGKRRFYSEKWGSKVAGNEIKGIKLKVK